MTTTKNEANTCIPSSPLKIVEGDLISLALDGHFNVIVHGCNCFHTMGSGIAKTIKTRFPGAYQADLKYGARGDIKKLGSYSVMLGKAFNIVNAYTQFGYNRPGEDRDRFEYAAFEKILSKLAKDYPYCNFGFPMIGMGKACGDQKTILGMLEAFAEQVTQTGGSVTLVKFSGEV